MSEEVFDGHLIKTDRKVLNDASVEHFGMNFLVWYLIFPDIKTKSSNNEISF